MHSAGAGAGAGANSSPLTNATYPNLRLSSLQTDILYMLTNSLGARVAHGPIYHLTAPEHATVECSVGSRARTAILLRLPRDDNDPSKYDLTRVVGWCLLTPAEQASGVLWLVCFVVS